MKQCGSISTWKFVLILVLLSASPSILKGQDYRAKVQGTVVDSSGGSVAGAKLTLRNIGAGTATEGRWQGRRHGW